MVAGERSRRWRLWRDELWVRTTKMDGWDELQQERLGDILVLDRGSEGDQMPDPGRVDLGVEALRGTVESCLRK